MPRKKKKKPGTSKKGGRRRVSGIGDGLPLLLSAFGGALGARILGNVVMKQFPTMNPKVLAGLQAAGGFILTRTKNPMLQGAGIGMFVQGGIAAGTAFGLITGMGGVGKPMVWQSRRVRGFNDVPQVGNVSTFANPSKIGQTARRGGSMDNAYANGVYG
jgi:hypothetical protein